MWDSTGLELGIKGWMLGSWSPVPPLSPTPSPVVSSCNSTFITFPQPLRFCRPEGCNAQALKVYPCRDSARCGGRERTARVGPGLGAFWGILNFEAPGSESDAQSPPRPKAPKLYRSTHITTPNDPCCNLGWKHDIREFVLSCSSMGLPVQASGVLRV